MDQNRADLAFRVSRVGARCISPKIRGRIVSHFVNHDDKCCNAQHTSNSKSSLYEVFLSLREYDVALG